ncbi:hypothetical protein RRG08_008874 [Elysia crispata]|uniref:C2H2-type domain-containing protein n=1 Tax=Elysia crispata TaxID=231223 RepID=A0AAE0ZWW5_9GAST|nr:hypothetical protein RRG08_008874 [Elysia crispata]
MAPTHLLFCSQCDFTTEKEKKLSKHIRRKHPSVKDGFITKKVVHKVKTVESLNGIKPDPASSDKSEKLSLPLEVTLKNSDTDHPLTQYGQDVTYELKAHHSVKHDNHHGTRLPKKRKKSNSSIAMPDNASSVKSDTLYSQLGQGITSQKLKTSRPSIQLGQHVASPLENHCSMEDSDISKKKLPRNKRTSLYSNGTMRNGASSVKSEMPDSQPGHEKTFNNFHVDTQLTQPGQKSESQNLNVDISPSALKCPFCKSDEYQFSSLKALSAHKKTFHKEIVLNCCFCEFSTTVLRKWHKHLRKNHCQNIDPLLKFLNIYIQQRGLERNELDS